jgi:hypothetical protein
MISKEADLKQKGGSKIDSAKDDKEVGKSQEEHEKEAPTEPLQQNAGDIQLQEQASHPSAENTSVEAHQESVKDQP